jgi:hypothetical protein
MLPTCSSSASVKLGKSLAQRQLFWRQEIRPPAAPLVELPGSGGGNQLGNVIVQGTCICPTDGTIGLHRGHAFSLARGGKSVFAFKTAFKGVTLERRDMAGEQNPKKSAEAWRIGQIRSEDLNASRDLNPPNAPALPRATLKLTRTLKVINDMQAAGVIGRYAIGGAVGATFYLEPMPTMDIDVFVAMHPEAGGLIITPKPVYDYLTARGYTAVGEALKVEDWLVQFLPPTGALAEEAIARARPVDVEGIPTFVFTAEHLVAVALETGRPKDKARILQFIDAEAVDQKALEEILSRHRMVEKWRQFRQQFLNGP